MLLLLLLLIIIICYLHKLIINLITWRLSVKMVSLSMAFLHFLTINEYWQIAIAPLRKLCTDVARRTLLNDKTKLVIKCHGPEADTV